MLVALNNKEAHSKHTHVIDMMTVPKFKISDLIMIKNFNKKSELGCKICSHL